MPGRAITFKLSALALVVALTACQTPQPKHGTEDNSSSNDHVADNVSFPSGFRTELATRLLSDYVREAVGPATISEIIKSHGLIGANASIAIRYPMRVANYIFDPNLVMTRCIVVRVSRSGYEGKLAFTMDRDAGACSSYKQAEPYVELEQMAIKLKACKARGEERCLLSTNLPEADARKLMNQR